MNATGETSRGRTWRIGDTTHVLDGDPWLMGILNVTPDSFSDGGQFLEPDLAVEHGLRMAEAGADWQLHTYGNALHAFTNPEANDPEFGTVYNAAADERSWQSLTHFLKEVF